MSNARRSRWQPSCDGEKMDAEVERLCEEDAISADRGHMRFVGGTIYCPHAERRFNLGPDHRIHDEFVCPGCNAHVPAKVIA